MNTYQEIKQNNRIKTKLVQIRTKDPYLIEFLEWFSNQEGANVSDFTRMLWRSSADYQEWLKTILEENNGEANTG